MKSAAKIASRSPLPARRFHELVAARLEDGVDKAQVRFVVVHNQNRPGHHSPVRNFVSVAVSKVGMRIRVVICPLFLTLLRDNATEVYGRSGGIGRALALMATNLHGVSRIVRY